jgi:hypothetical protein
MRAATIYLAVLFPAALIGAGLFLLWDGTGRLPSQRAGPSATVELDRPPSLGTTHPAPAPAESLLAAPAAGSPAAQAPREHARPSAPEPRVGPENALVFQVVDARTAQPLSTFEVRVGQAYLRPLLDDEGRIRHDHPAGRVRFPDVIEASAGESVQLSITAHGYAELRVPDLFVAPGRELDLGTLRLERAPRIILRVLDELTGEPLFGARVRISPAGQVPPSDERPPLPSALDPWSGRTDQDGRVLLDSRPGEQVRITVRHATHAPLDALLFVPLSEEYQETVRLRPRE